MNTAITEKLAKMMRQQESAAKIGSIAEAEAFGAKIQQLLTQHGLSMSQIEVEQEVAEAEQVEETYVRANQFGETRKRAVVQWQSDLLREIARANNCKNLIVSGSNTLVLVGFASDKAVCVSLFAYFVNLGKQLCESAFKAYKKSDDWANDTRWCYGGGELAGVSRNWKKSFLLGFAHSVGTRLYKAKQEAVSAVEASQPQSVGLVHLRNKEALVKDFFDKQTYGRYRGGSGARNGNAYNQGQRAGSSVGLSGKSLGAGGGGQLN